MSDQQFQELLQSPAATFPWHAQQEHALRAATDIIAVIGGNRSGKSKVGEGIVSRVVRREGPIYRRLRKAKGRKLNIWVAPQTDEKAKSLWEPRLLKMFEGMKFDYIQSPHRCFTWEDENGGGTLWLKSQEQGFMSFESDEVDLCLFDEEPEDRRVYASAKTRFATTNGVVVLTFTPLNGMTWTHGEIYAPAAGTPEYQVADRFWRMGNEISVIVMGMADNPEAVAGGGVARMLADPAMTEAEKAARLYGRYGFTEGLLFPTFADLKTENESIYVIDRLPADRAYRWILTADPNKRHGALLSAIDNEGNRYYCAEHYAEGIPDSEHAEGYRMMLHQFRVKVDEVMVFADPGGAGSQAIINLAETGFFAEPVPKDPGSVGASIKRLRRAAHVDPKRLHPTRKDDKNNPKRGSPQVFFLRTLCSRWTTAGQQYEESRLLWELRQYRQKDNAAPDTPVKRNDDLVDCARYIELAHPESAEPFTLDKTKEERAKLDQLSRVEAERYESLLKSITKKNPLAVAVGVH